MLFWLYDHSCVLGQAPYSIISHPPDRSHVYNQLGASFWLARLFSEHQAFTSTRQREGTRLALQRRQVLRKSAEPKSFSSCGNLWRKTRSPWLRGQGSPSWDKGEAVVQISLHSWMIHFTLFNLQGLGLISQSASVPN